MERGYFVCVDDEISVVETLREQLQGHFGDTHEIEVANNAEDALSLIDDIHGSGGLVELVISDQVMPGMKGDSFLQEVHRKLPDTIKIMLTGQADMESVTKALNQGGLDRYVEKPWNFDILKQEITDLITKFHENIENQRMLQSLERRIAELEGES